MNLLIIAIGIGLSITFFAIFLLFTPPSRQSELLSEVTSRAYQSEDVGLHQERFSAESLTRPLGSLRRLFGGPPNPEIVHRLLLAGYRKPFHADTFLGAKLTLPAVAGVGVAFFVQDNVILWFVLALLVGFIAPDLWLSHAINKRRERIQRSLPDALDLLAICTEAGLGLDQAIVRVAQELRFNHPELSEELIQINLEQRAGNPRIGAGAAWQTESTLRASDPSSTCSCRRNALEHQSQKRWQYFPIPCAFNEDNERKSLPPRRRLSCSSLSLSSFSPVSSS